MRTFSSYHSFITAELIGPVVEQLVSSYTIKEINKLRLIACNLLSTQNQVSSGIHKNIYFHGSESRFIPGSLSFHIAFPFMQLMASVIHNFPEMRCQATAMQLWWDYVDLGVASSIFFDTNKSILSCSDWARAICTNRLPPYSEHILCNVAQRFRDPISPINRTTKWK